MTEASNVVMRKVAKLMSLASRAGTPEEAAAAAAQAQKLMTEHQLTSSMVALADPLGVAGSSTESIVDFSKKDAPLFAKQAKLKRWEIHLASGIARANGCYIFYSSTRGFGRISIVGKPTPVEGVRYVYEFVKKQIDDLAGEHKGSGRTWLANFRLGCVETVASRMTAARKAEATALREAAEARATATARPASDVIRRVVSGREYEIRQDGARVGLFLDGLFAAAGTWDGSTLATDSVLPCGEPGDSEVFRGLLAETSSGYTAAFAAIPADRAIAIAARAVAAVEEDSAAAQEYIEADYKERTGRSFGKMRPSTARYDFTARATGRKAGESIDIGGKGNKLTGGHKRLGRGD